MIEDAYKIRCEKTTDINEHLPVLRKLASQVDHVTEFGVREGNSTIAFAAANPSRLISYDIEQIPADLEAQIAAFLPRFSFSFIRADVLTVEIEPTDLLFIDSFHTYAHLKKELELHANKVRKYIVFHDTESFGMQGEDGSTPGLNAAINEFVLEEGWTMNHYANNNGLTVLTR